MNRIGSTRMEISIWTIYPDDLQAVQATLFYKLQSFNSKKYESMKHYQENQISEKRKLRYFPCLIKTLNPICSRFILFLYHDHQQNFEAGG